MKSFLSSKLLPAIFLLVVACNTPKEDPAAAVKAFYDALAVKDFEKARQYATQESKTMLELIESMSQMAAGIMSEDDDFEKMKKAIIGPAEIEGDKASVKVQIGEEETIVKLIKENGEWKVALDKETLKESLEEKSNESKGNLNPSPEDASIIPENTIDSTENPEQ